MTMTMTMTTTESTPDSAVPRVGRPRKEVFDAAKRRSIVLGIVEEAMRALIEAGVQPATTALSWSLPDVGIHSIRKAQAELVRSGVVAIPDGLPTVESAVGSVRAAAASRAIRDALGRRSDPDEEGPVPTPEACNAMRFTAVDLERDDVPRTSPGRRRGRPFRKLVRAHLERERGFIAYARTIRPGEREEASDGA